MKYILIAACLSAHLVADAQRVVDVDKDNNTVPIRYHTVSGSMFTAGKYVRVVSGTPYFSENWMKGQMILSQGGACAPMPARIDLLENTIEYIDEKGQTMIATTPVKEIRLTDTVTGNSYRFVHSSFIPGKDASMKNGWYLLLAEGKASVYQLQEKFITETKSYGNATTEQSVQTGRKYFVSYNGVLTPVKKIKDVPALLSDKSEALGAFIDRNKLSGKTEKDFSQLITHYNSL